MMEGPEALALLISLKLSRHQYETLRKILKSKHALCIPSYKVVRATKKLCVPKSRENPTEFAFKIEKREGHLELNIGIQDVLDHQTERILLCQTLVDSILQFAKDTEAEFTLWSKYGCDSATAHSVYQTKDCIEHGSIFTSYLTPVALEVTWQNSNRKPVNLWINEMANSPYGSIYIRIAFEKENDGMNVSTCTTFQHLAAS